MKEKTIRLGVIGIGNMGSQHCKSILDGKTTGITLAAVADSNPDRVAWAKKELPESVAVFSDALEMLDSGKVDSVLVAVPHYDHPKYAMECIKRGLHVLVEKPAGVYTKQVRQMNALADQHPEVVFGMMFNQRTNHIYRKMKELVDSGKYGQIRRTNWIVTNWYRPQAYYDSGAWRATWKGEGGGVLLNQCPHQLDLWQWICGMPVEVTSHLSYGQWHDIEVEDDVTAFVKYANGATGVFITTTGDGAGTNRFEIQMDKAKLVAEGGKLMLTAFEVSEPEFTKTCTDPFGSIPKKIVEVETDGKSAQHPEVMTKFAEAILSGKPLTAQGQDGINGLMLSNAMHLSSWLNKTVTLPIDEELYYEELMKRVATSKAKTNIKTVVADTSNSYSGTESAQDKFEKHWKTNW